MNLKEFKLVKNKQRPDFCYAYEKPETYQVYLNGNWIADCNSYEEAETIANGNAMNGSINIERI